MKKGLTLTGFKVQKFPLTKTHLARKELLEHKF